MPFSTLDKGVTCLGLVLFGGSILPTLSAFGVQVVGLLRGYEVLGASGTLMQSGKEVAPVTFGQRLLSGSGVWPLLCPWWTGPFATWIWLNIVKEHYQDITPKNEKRFLPS